MGKWLFISSSNGVKVERDSERSSDPPGWIFRVTANRNAHKLVLNSQPHYHVKAGETFFVVLGSPMSRPIAWIDS